MLQEHLGLPRTGLHPGVEDHHAGHPRIAPRIDAHCAGPVTQTPQDDLLEPRLGRKKGVHGGPNVLAHVQEVARRAAGIAHSAIIEAQTGHPARRQIARQTDELAMAADPVLGPADHDQHPDASRPLRRRKDPDQRLSAALEDERPILPAHRTNPFNASTEASISGSQTSISWVCQKATPGTTAARAAVPALAQRSTGTRSAGDTS